MADHYSVIFRGDIVLGENLADVKHKLGQLFKVDDARIERIFTGKPVPLKVNIALVQAKKYQAALAQAGAVTAIIDNSADTASNARIAPASSLVQNIPAADSPIKTATTKAPAGIFSLAPAGSRLLEDRQLVSHKPIDITHIALSPQGGNIVNDAERQAPLPALVNADDLTWGIAEIGEVILQATKKLKIKPVNVDADILSLADVGSSLLNEDDRQSFEALDVDISYLQLAPHNPFR
ncbi:MAG: hypothetical protein ACI80S_001083 [Pseudohongiellaceae bacterium]|jgi:hypothetical protein